MDGGAWRATVHGVAKSRTRLSDFTFTFHFHALEKEMATHSSVLAWRIPGIGEPGELLSMGSHRVRHDWSHLAAAAATISGFPGSASSRESACKCTDVDLIPGLGRSPEIGNGNPLQYSCMEHSMERGVWGATVNEVTQSDRPEHTQQHLFHRDFHKCSFVPKCVKFLLRIYFRDQLSHHLLNIPPGPPSSQNSLPAKCLSE